MKLESGLTTLRPRNLGGLLDETVAIYVRHLRSFLALVFVVQAPISLVSFAILQTLGQGWATITVVLVLGLFGALFVYGAIAFAVGLHYVDGAFDIRRCYTVAWWRIVSLMMLAVIVIPMLVVVVLLGVSDRSFVISMALLMAVPAVAVAIYWSMAIQAVVVEGGKAASALGRSFALIRGSWWRIFGITLVLGLVAIGLSILVNIPFIALSTGAGLDPSTGLGAAVNEVAALIVVTITTPVLFIAGTLLYYDMRVRREKYDLATLSREMGMTSA